MDSITSYTLAIIILIILLVLILSVWAVDIALFIVPRLERIRIGRWDSREKWMTAIIRTALRWLQHTPTLRVSDENRLVLIDIVRKRYRRHAIQSWQQAGLVLGLSEALDPVHAPKVKPQIDRFIDQVMDRKSGQWRARPQEIDAALLAYALMKSRWIDIKQMKPALDLVMTLIKDRIGDDGCIAYRRSRMDIRFVDTVGFVCPFLVRYALALDQPQYIRLALAQLDQYDEHGFNQLNQLPIHAYDSKQHLPLGTYTWGRGLGWYLLGLMDTYLELPGNHPDYQLDRERLAGRIFKLSESLLRWQLPHGGFGSIIGYPRSPVDSSITAIAGWFLTESYLIDHDKRYLDAAAKSLQALQARTRQNGKLDFCQGDTKDIGVYASRFDVMPFAQGIAIRLVNRYKIALQAEKPIGAEQPIRILFLINNLKMGGAEKVLVNLVNRMDRAKYHLTLRTLTRKGNHVSGLQEHIQLESVFENGFRGLNYLHLLPHRYIYQKVAGGDFDIIVAYLHGVLTKIVAFAPPGQRTIAYCHSNLAHSPFVKSFITKQSMIQCFSTYQAIVSVSQEVARYFGDLPGLASRLHVIYNTFDVEGIERLSRQPLNLRADGFTGLILCAVGKLIPVKGYERLLRTIHRLREAGHPIRLYLIGHGPLARQHAQYIADHNLQEAVILAGFQANPYPYMANADLFVCSSYSEGFSSVVVESLILGVPVITTACAGMTEILGENNEFGLIVENSEAGLFAGLESLVTNPAVLDHYRQQAIRRRPFFAADKTVREVEGLMDQLMNGRPNG